VGFPAFVANSTKPTLDQFIDHIAYIANLVGIDHTGLGIDYYPNMDSASKLEDAKAYYKYSIDNGRWRADAYPPPPHIYPTGIESPRTLENLTVRLAERGFSDNDIRKVLGGNWMRVYREVWGC
jgi:membrane dipeptidase